MTWLWLLAIAAGLFAMSVATVRLNKAFAIWSVVFIAAVLVAWAVEAGA